MKGLKFSFLVEQGGIVCTEFEMRGVLLGEIQTGLGSFWAVKDQVLSLCGWRHPLFTARI